LAEFLLKIGNYKTKQKVMQGVKRMAEGKKGKGGLERGGGLDL